MFKIDTREKFTAIAPDCENLSDNLTEEFSSIILSFLQKDIKNVVLNLKNVQSIHENAAQKLSELQQHFYENNASFVICEIQPAVETILENGGLLDIMNITPTESEAWDIVQMEEIERELLDDDEPFFTDNGEDGNN